MKTFLQFGSLVLRAGIASAQAPAATASATIADAMGKTVGTATLREAHGGVLIEVDLVGAPPIPWLCV